MDAIRRIIISIVEAIDRSNNPLDSMPDFSTMSYQYGQSPAHPSIPAWEKLRECERRWVYFNWTESLNDPRKAQHRVVLDDALAAFLLTFEATIQYIKDAFRRSQNAPHFEKWISSHNDQNILVRGLRSLRHLEAHVEDVPISSLVKVGLGGSRSDGTSASDVKRTWRLPTLDRADLSKLRFPKISNAELQNWNDLVSQRSAKDLLETALIQLKAILSSAENVV